MREWLQVVALSPGLEIHFFKTMDSLRASVQGVLSGQLRAGRPLGTTAVRCVQQDNLALVCDVSLTSTEVCSGLNGPIARCASKRRREAVYHTAATKLILSVEYLESRWLSQNAE